MERTKSWITGLSNDPIINERERMRVSMSPFTHCFVIINQNAVMCARPRRRNKDSSGIGKVSPIMKRYSLGVEYRYTGIAKNTSSSNNGMFQLPSNHKRPSILQKYSGRNIMLVFATRCFGIMAGEFNGSLHKKVLL
jgi:hypothetical protein